MFPPGHYGMALLLYAFLGYVLLKRGYVRDALSGGGVVLSLTLLPDIDGQFDFLVHRGVTHTLWFAVAVGAFCVVALSGSLYGRSRRDATVGALWAFFLGWFAIVAHLIADVLNPWGVMPLYPLTPALYSLDVVRATNDAANYAVLVVGILAALTAVVAGHPSISQPRPLVRLYQKVWGQSASSE
ncbi:metal-dependent hydrolase [Halorussus halophilus]|uniref:metal-dependent hydrolase n=1 Tax=Halorussus halophilus TaxID=2650975 RepID=UPI001301983C|nr:metal-dependent hydrolase [Halorussus halophilus]